MSDLLPARSSDGTIKRILVRIGRGWCIRIIALVWFRRLLSGSVKVIVGVSRGLWAIDDIVDIWR